MRGKWKRARRAAERVSGKKKKNPILCVFRLLESGASYTELVSKFIEVSDESNQLSSLFFLGERDSLALRPSTCVSFRIS